LEHFFSLHIYVSSNISIVPTLASIPLSPNTVNLMR